jgi:hypothetical protein
MSPGRLSWGFARPRRWRLRFPALRLAWPQAAAAHAGPRL